MHEFLPLGPEGKYSGEFTDEHAKTKEISHHEKRTKPGELYTKKIKAVCPSCNNGWMSGIEEGVIPSLTPLIKGEAATLNADQLAIVARWGALKAIILEHDRRETEVTPQSERTAFMANGTIPPHFNIYLLSHASKSRIGHVRTTHLISRSKDGPSPPIEGRQKNVQQISVILGSVMLYVNAARIDDFSIEQYIDMPAVIALRIWPPNVVPLSWPTKPFLNNQQMYQLAYSMDRIAAQPQVRWGGELPIRNPY